jgi:hypothetical protein
MYHGRLVCGLCRRRGINGFLSVSVSTMSALGSGAIPSANVAVMTDQADYHNTFYESKNVKTTWQKIVTFIWDAWVAAGDAIGYVQYVISPTFTISDYYDKTPEERKLVHKLDCTLLTVLIFGWLMKYIDQSNVGIQS